MVEANFASTATGHTVVHLAVMHNRIWALRRLQAIGVDLTAPLQCYTRSCDLLGGAPWFETGPPQSGIPVLYLATLYGVLEVLEFLTSSDTGA